MLATSNTSCLKHKFLNSGFEVMHGNCLQQMFMRGSSKLWHTPHEHHCTFELQFSFLPLSSICLIRKGLTKSGSAAVMFFILCRSSSTGILSTAFYKKRKEKKCRYKKNIQNLFYVYHVKKNQWNTFHTINETLSSWSLLFSGPAAKESCWFWLTPLLDTLRLLLEAYGWWRCYKIQQNIIPSLSRRTSSWWEGEHQQLVANTPRIYIYMYLLCSLA